MIINFSTHEERERTVVQSQRFPLKRSAEGSHHFCSDFRKNCLVMYLQLLQWLRDMFSLGGQPSPSLNSVTRGIEKNVICYYGSREEWYWWTSVAFNHQRILFPRISGIRMTSKPMSLHCTEEPGYISKCVGRNLFCFIAFIIILSS